MPSSLRGPACTQLTFPLTRFRETTSIHLTPTNTYNYQRFTANALLSVHKHDQNVRGISIRCIVRDRTCSSRKEHIT